MAKTRQEIVKDFGKRVMEKQHDHRHLPRTRCIAKLAGQERLEFVLPEGVDASVFCRGWKKLDPEAHQVVYPQFQSDLEAVLINFDVVPLVFVRLDTKP